MALVNRLTRLFQADFHAVLDRIEEPDLQLKQAVREMQFALEQDRQRQKLLRHEAAQLERDRDAIAATLATLDEELDLCLAAKKDDLARDLVRRKLAAARRGDAIARQLVSVGEQVTALDRQIDEQAEQLAGMQQKLELLVADEARTSAGAAGADFADAIRGEEIEIALLREKQRRTKS